MHKAFSRCAVFLATAMMAVVMSFTATAAPSTGLALEGVPCTLIKTCHALPTVELTSSVEVADVVDESIILARGKPKQRPVRVLGIPCYMLKLCPPPNYTQVVAETAISS